MFDLKRLDKYIGTAKCERYDDMRAAKVEIERLRALISEVVGDERDWTDAAYALELPSRLAESGWFNRARAALT